MDSQTFPPEFQNDTLPHGRISNEYLIYVSFDHSHKYSMLRYLSLYYYLLGEHTIAASLDQPTNIFFDELKNNFYGIHNCKGAIFDLFNCDSFEFGYEFRVECKNFCENLKIPYVFASAWDLRFGATLLATNANVDFGDSVTMVFPMEEKIIVADFIRNKKGFKLVTFESFSLETNAEELRQKIVTERNATKWRKFTKIILSFKFKKIEKLIHILKRDILTTVESDYDKTFYANLVNIVQDLRGKIGNQFKIRPKLFGNIMVAKQQMDVQRFGQFLIRCHENMLLPFEENVNVLVDDESVCVNIQNPSTKKYVCHKSFNLSSFKFKKVQVIFKIDVNGFYSCELENQIDKLALCGDLWHKDVRLELSNEGLSISVKGFKTFKDINGDWFIPPYISFLNKNFVIGEKAKALKATHPSFVVYDFFTIIEMLFADIEPKPEWGFAIEKPDTEIIHVVFDTFNGKRKATSHFLVALLIKHLLNLAKKLLGFMPKQVSVALGHKTIDAQKFKKEISKSFRMLNIERHNIIYC